MEMEYYGPEGMLNNFEKMLVYDIYRCHLTKSRKGSFNSGIQVQVSSFEMKKGKGRIATKYRIKDINSYRKNRERSSKSIVKQWQGWNRKEVFDSESLLSRIKEKESVVEESKLVASSWERRKYETQQDIDYNNICIDGSNCHNSLHTFSKKFTFAEFTVSVILKIRSL